jgi:hypothetical protein
MPINSFLYPGAKFTPAYDVANSCRFDASSSAYMHKTPSSTGVEEKFTFSFWIKYNHTHSSNQCVLFIEGDNGANDYVEVAFKPHLDIQFNNGTYSRYETNRKFRDPSAWYHIVIAVDTTQSTASNRLKLYVNGTQETSWATETQIPQNDVLQANTSGKKMWLNAHYNGPKNFIDGYLAEVVWIDGTQYAASDFGEFDEDSPTIWKPKDVSGLTFGTNGFYLDFEDSSNLGNDANGGTDLTEVNLDATHQSTDTCTNNFCTMNPLYNAYVDPTFSEGNLKITQSSAWAGAKATMGVSTGKWYWEVKISGTLADHHHGVQQENVDETAQNPQNTTGTTVFFNSDGGEMKSDSTATTANYGTLDDGDILGIALDMDAGSYGQITIFDNGSAIVSDFNLVSSSTTVMPFASIGNSTAEYNFGNPTFSITSSNSDANGYGSFEHSVPSGHYSLCTKNLAEYG